MAALVATIPHVKKKKKHGYQVTLKCYVMYTVCNIIRYITIGVLISICNDENTNNMHLFKRYCCSCYYISQNQSNYALKTNRRFDLSYCIPYCTDCDYCKTIYKTAQQAFDDVASINATCVVGNYTDDKPWAYWPWEYKKIYQDTGCDNGQISISSMYIFQKTYKAYARWAIVITIIYSVFLLVSIGAVYYLPDLAKSLLRWVWPYNIFISEICLYLLFKPFQYYEKMIIVGNNEVIKCKMNSMDVVAVKLISWTIIACLVPVIIHIIYLICRVCILCRKKCKNNTRRNVSIDAMLCETINYGTNKRMPFINMTINKRVWVWKCTALIVTILMCWFLGIVIYATVVMIKYQIKSDKEHKTKGYGMMSICLCFIFLSLFDNPWIFQSFKQRCCSKQRNKQHNTEVMMT